MMDSLLLARELHCGMGPPNLKIHDVPKNLTNGNGTFRMHSVEERYVLTELTISAIVLQTDAEKLALPFCGVD
jgi:hypothetical protein